MNVGSEINGTRPAIIYKASSYKYGEDIIVLPITSFEGVDGEEKSKDSLDVILEENKNNGIGHKSLIKVRQIRCISKKRLKKEKKTGNIKILGVVDDKALKIAITTNIIKMFGLNENID
jgi:mRNA-degrading endonuclease toxin of MazEF toxin-antitoxin module